MTDTDILPDKEVMARTLWGEARSEGIAGMAAVACCIMNRVNLDLHNDNKPDWWGEGIKAVCLKPFQYSCWNSNDPNRTKLINMDVNDPYYKQAKTIAWLAADGWLADKTNGATHYFYYKITPPNWSVGKTPCARIGNHVFYDLRKDGG